MVVKGEEKNKVFYENEDFYLILISLLFFIFFFSSFFHDLANSLPIRLHFCDHFFCILFSLIWLILFIFNLIHFFRNSDSKKENDDAKGFRWRIFCFVVIFFIGILLMNITYCNLGGKIIFGFENNNLFLESEDDAEFEKKNDVFVDNSAEISSNLEDPFYSNGSLRSNLCLDKFILREYNLLDSGSVLVEDIDCKETYGSTSCCQDGKCIVNCFDEEIVSCDVYFDVYSGRDNYGFNEDYEGERCLDVAESNCLNGVEWNYEHFDLYGNCCVWKCLEKRSEPEIFPQETCQDIDSGLIHETATCYDGDYYFDYCADKLVLVRSRCLDNSCVDELFLCDLYCDGISNVCK
jgi:hypothetical protein